MIRDFKFTEIIKYLEKDSTVGKEILDAVKSLASAAIIFSPIVFGAQFLPLLELLELNDKLFELDKKGFRFLCQKK